MNEDSVVVSYSVHLVPDLDEVMVTETPVDAPELTERSLNSV